MPLCTDAFAMDTGSPIQPASRPRHSYLLRCLLATLLLCLAAPPTVAQDAPEPDPATDDSARAAALRAHELNQAAAAAFAAQDYPAAEAALRELATLQPDNFVVYYNLACACSLQNDPGAAVGFLLRAVELGYDDLTHLSSDPDLANARTSETYQSLIRNWDKVLALRADANFRAVQKAYGPKYTYIKDESLRLAYASAFDPTTFAQARSEIERLAAWGIANIFTDLQDEAKKDADPWVVVILPTRRDFNRWAAATYGAGAIGSFRQIGGQYSHDTKRLIAQDLGGTLRHEFFHILHWRSMTRLGQFHPVWVQEGLCSLVEDYDLQADGSLRITPSWRTNIVRRLARANNLFKLEKLAALTHERFSNTNPLSNYAQSRAVFMYLLSAGKLMSWYEAYTAGYREDPTGIQALEQTIGKPIAEINADYKAWARDLPEVADQSRPGTAELNLDVDGASGEGLEIIDTPPTAISRAGLRLGDVITAINGRPTRDVNELYRVLADYQPGDEVEIAYRRGLNHGMATVTLTER
jgi:hypothetical protein